MMRGVGPTSALLLACAACSGDAVITLGQAVPVPDLGDAGRPVAAINGPFDEGTPTLTADLLEVFFSSKRSGQGEGDIWSATRANRADPFDAPTPVLVVNTDQVETSPAISLDGLTLWFASDRLGGSGGLDVWRSTRSARSATWSPPVNVPDLSSDRDDLPRPPAENDLVMPLASKRDTHAEYETYLARRNSVDAPFDEVLPVSELWLEGSSMEEAFLTENGLLLFFNREVDGAGDLFLAWRHSPGAPFEAPIALDTVNTEFDERAPWVNLDGTRFFFATNRRPGRGLDIFATTLDLPHFN
jgi:hypothetical protein